MADLNFSEDLDVPPTLIPILCLIIQVKGFLALRNLKHTRTSKKAFTEEDNHEASLGVYISQNTCMSIPKLRSVSVRTRSTIISH